MVRKAVVVFLLLSGCSDNPKLWRESEITEVARQAPRNDIAILQGQIIDLKSELTRLKSDNEFQDKYIDISLKGADDNARRIDRAAKIVDQNSVLDMTMRGRCGVEQMQDYEGGPLRWQNKECTVKDLSEPK